MSKKPMYPNPAIKIFGCRKWQKKAEDHGLSWMHVWHLEMGLFSRLPPEVQEVIVTETKLKVEEIDAMFVEYVTQRDDVRASRRKKRKERSAKLYGTAPYPTDE